MRSPSALGDPPLGRSNTHPDHTLPSADAVAAGRRLLIKILTTTGRLEYLIKQIDLWCARLMQPRHVFCLRGTRLITQ